MYKENNDPTEPRPFRLCERCGRPTPGALPQCVNCGAISSHGVVADEQARAERRFARAFFSRATPVTYALLLINIGVFVLMAVTSRGSDDPGTLIAFGAKTNDLLRRGEWFRLVTPIFIHAGPLHLLLNSYALWAVGPQVEKLYGSARFLLIYMLAGIGGVAGSFLGQMIFRRPDVPSVGASGAIFGLFGVLAVFGYRYRHELPPTFRRALGAGVLPVIVINLVIGFSFPFIDNAAHIGGLITGAILTLIIPYIAPGAERVSKVGLLIIALCVAVMVYCFAQAYRANERGAVVESYLNGINSAQKALRQAFRASLESASPQDRQTATDSLSGAIEQLQKARTPDQQSDQIRLELLRIARKQQSLMTAPAGSEKMNEVLANYDDYEKTWSRLENWVKSEGPRYGLTLGRDDRQSK
ncbi:MAG: rhomboid family intramembrane serine protease [Blastocatellales bacterium]